MAHRAVEPFMPANRNRADEETFHRCLSGIVTDLLGGQPVITSLHRNRSKYSSWYAAEILTVRVAAGAELKIFMKDFGSYFRAKDGMEQRRDREMRVYKELLAQADLGTARYYGSVVDASRGRFWLLLEYVDGMPVRYCDLKYWIAAAGWLGRMHGHFARQSSRLSATCFLVRHDIAFFLSKADLALAAVSHISPALARRLSALLNGYDRLAEVMASGPHTLVHGAYRAKEILVSAGSDPPRICPVDWELAAFGAPLYDLAQLTDGFKPAMLDRFWNAYREQANACGLALRDRQDMSYVLNCFRLHHVMNWLSQSRDREFPETQVARLVDLGEKLRSLILEDRP